MNPFVDVLPMKAPTLPIRLNKQLSGGYEPHLLEPTEKRSCEQQSNAVHKGSADQ